MEIIAKHLIRGNLKIPVFEMPEGSICSFTGKKISEGVRNKDLIKDTFTDHEYVKYPSPYSSVEAALCIEEVYPSESGKGFNSLRNYNYYASESVFRILKSNEVLDLLLNIPETPFHIALTFSNKKHTSYKTVTNTDKGYFLITTDKYNCYFDREQVNQFLPIISSWYTVVTGKEDAAMPPTYFTKEEIRGEKLPMYQKIAAYGLERFEQENEALNQFRNTNIFNLIVHFLQKSYAKN